MHAGLPVAFGTSHVALKERANVQPGQTVLVLGAAGGVGMAAVQVSSATGLLFSPEAYMVQARLHWVIDAVRRGAA